MSGTPGIFVATLTVGGAPQTNATVLQTAINAAQASGNPCGAIVMIPSFPDFPPTLYGSYNIGTLTPGSPVITVPEATYAKSPLLICGTGIGTTLLMQTASPSSGENVLFDIADTASVTFQDLTIIFSGNDGFSQSGVAFNFTDGSEHGLFRIEINNCQYPVLVNACANVTMRQCHFNYGTHFNPPSMSPATAIQVTGGSSQVSITECLLSYYADAPGGPFTGIVIGESSFTRVRDTQITSFGTGIIIAGAPDGALASHVMFAGVRTSAHGSCLVIEPSVYNVGFVNCRFEAGDVNDGLAPGIQVGTITDENGSLDTIIFTSCFLIGNYGFDATGAYGMQINAGQNIQINGGKYSGTGNGAGIAVLGQASEIQINGVNCIGLDSSLEQAGMHPDPLYQLYGIKLAAGQNIQVINANCSSNGSSSWPGCGIYINGSGVNNVKIIGTVCVGALPGGTSYQQYGIYAIEGSTILILDSVMTGNNGSGVYLTGVSEGIVSACDAYGNGQGIFVGNACSNVFLRDNNISGYSTLGEALSFGSSLTAVEVTDCAGYNDQKALLAGPAALPPTGPFDGIVVDGYYGPTTFCLTGPQTVAINTYPTDVSLGAFTLGPGDSAEITGGTPSLFLMVGN